MSVLTTPIIILHGLGNRAWTLILLEWYLRWCGFKRVYRPQYNADTDPEVACSYLSKPLTEFLNGNARTPIVVIGNSMGGLVGSKLKGFGFNVSLLITINSPLNGARLLRQLDSWVPTRVMDVCGGNSQTYTYLKTTMKASIPNHPYKTISTSLPFMSFDGMVYREDAMIEPEHHTDIPWGSHHTVIFDPRVYWRIKAILDSYTLLMKFE
jgi:hypothetical protein